MQRAEHQPETMSVTIYAGIYYKLWRVAAAGTIIPQHAHEFPHITALLQGTVRVWRNDQMWGDHTDYTAPATILIPARTKHRFETLTHSTVLACIHNADCLDAGEPAVHAEHHIVTEG